jgi:hypothetical protein
MGSNPFGCANIFNSLDYKSQSQKTWLASVASGHWPASPTHGGPCGSNQFVECPGDKLAPMPGRALRYVLRSTSGKQLVS